MHIATCIRQVPDPSYPVDLDVDTGLVRIDVDNVAWAINAYDELGVELALQFKDRYPETSVTALGIGPERTTAALRRCLAMGCDAAARAASVESHLGSPLGRTFASMARELRADVVLVGAQVSDDDQDLLGVSIAQALGSSYIGNVSGLALNGSRLAVDRDIEGGVEHWLLDTPAVLAVKSANDPRYPPLAAILSARRRPVPEMSFVDLDQTDSRLPAIRAMQLVRRAGGTIVKDADVQSTASLLVRLLREEAKVI